MMSVALAVLIVTLTALFARLTHADGVCGDSAIDAPEQCDDGNLSNGDGCSNQCVIEGCGNGLIDAYEQCDDSNEIGGDGCNQYCQIEFCGDQIVQAGIAEQCDDGNGIAGDGCSSTCLAEASSSSSSSSSSFSSSEMTSSSSTSMSSSASFASSASSAISSSAYAILMAPQVQQVMQNFLSPENDAYAVAMNAEQQNQLLQIMHQMENLEPLTEQERVWAQELLATLTAARDAEREKYTDLLKQFIATPISTDVVTEEQLSEQRLVDVAIPIAVDELKQAIETIERGDLKKQVLSDIAKLKLQNIDPTSGLPTDFADRLDAGTSPVTVFETLKAIKEAAEQYATPDLDASLATIRTQVQAVRDALPVFEREYGVPSEKIADLLADIDAVTLSVTKQDVYRVVASVNRLLSALKREDVLQTVDLLASSVAVPHAAAHAAQILDAVGLPQETAPDVRSVAVGLSAKAPAEYKDAFEQGSVEEQRAALLRFLGNQERVPELLQSLPMQERDRLHYRLTQLSRAIVNVGTKDDSEMPCDDSMQEALRCTTVYLRDLEDAVRSRSVLQNLIGTLQDFFGIDS